jgi:ABC-type Na+ transport system ATPase subunit NatA
VNSIATQPGTPASVWSAPERAKALLGVLLAGLSLPGRLTGRELLEYLGALGKMDLAEPG